jgi:PTH1 family peptidyl-tRNA hydrolase
MQASKFKLIVGLGNPDKKYANTYHNAGFLFLDYLAKNQQISNFQFPIIKSEVYMNESGRFVAKVLKKHNVKPENLLIVHDDSDLTLGNYKLSFGQSAAGHHGVESIQTTLKTKNFWRLRIGIRPSAAAALAKGNRRLKAGEFVLKKISTEHQKLLKEVFEKAALKIQS